MCPGVQPWRQTRHNRVCQLIEKELAQRGYQVRREPRLSTPRGVFRPDLLATKNDETWIIDGQVTSDSNVRPLSELHALKRAKYDRQVVLDAVFNMTGARPKGVYPITINWRGFIFKDSVETLKLLGIGSIASLLSVRALEGGVSILANYNGMAGGGRLDL